MGDIGTHAWHLAEYVTGLKVQEVCADLQTYVKGRPVDDDGALLLRMEEGVTGVLMATQIATGEANNIRVRVYGDKGGLEWRQMDSNRLFLRWGDKQSEELYMGNNEFLGELALWNTRTPRDTPRDSSRPSPISTEILPSPSWPRGDGKFRKSRYTISQRWMMASGACSSSRQPLLPVTTMR